MYISIALIFQNNQQARAALANETISAAAIASRVNNIKTVIKQTARMWLLANPDSTVKDFSFFQMAEIDLANIWVQLWTHALSQNAITPKTKENKLLIYSQVSF